MLKRVVIASLGLAVLLTLGLTGSADSRSIDPQTIAARSASNPQERDAHPMAAEGQVGELQLGYDSGPEVYTPDLDLINAEWSVRFSPPQTCSLIYIQLVTYEQSGNLSLSVYSDLDGYPAALISGPHQFFATGDLTYQRIDLPSPIDVGAADFHVAIGITHSPTPHPTFDNDGGTLRTSYRFGSDPWENVDNLDMVLQAFVRTYGADITPPTLLHIPVSVAFSGNNDVEVVALISDQSGIQAADLHYSTDGVVYQSATLTEAGGFYRGTIPAFTSGTHVRYYLSAQDLAPSPNTALFPDAGSAAPFSYIIQPGTELYYDDGLPEQFYIESDIYDGNAFAVNFWPSSYPVMVSHVRILVDDTATFAVTIQRDVSGSPGEVIAGPYAVSADPFSGWTDVYIPEGDQPMLTWGGFFVVLYWFPESPDMPGVATDISAPSDHSYWYDNAFGWNRFSDGDWIMRAAVQMPTGVVELSGAEPPHGWRLAQNAPNPFNPSTSISFAMPRSARVDMVIHNILGQTVRNLSLGVLEPGEYSIDWDGRDEGGHPVGTGIYFYTLRAGEYIQTRKMLLLK